MLSINSQWILCPLCGNKTRNKIREDTVLKNYPLYCPKCRQETLIEVEKMCIRDRCRVGTIRISI